MEPVDHLSVPRNHDLVTIVSRDHATLSSMLGAAVDAGPADGSDRFGAAVHELARHDGAEDRVVPGAVRATGQGAVHGSLLDHWQRQQDGLEHALHELERLRGAASFAPALGRFADLVAEHAAWEKFKFFKNI